MSNPNPTSFRIPVQVDKSVHSSVHRAFESHDQSIQDLRQAVAALKAQLNTATQGKTK